MQHINDKKIKFILEEVAQWAARRTDIAAAALVGSWARGTARVDSDIDLMILTDSLMLFRQDEGWIDEIQLADMDAHIASWEDQDYGVVWSRHVCLDDKTKIEFSFGSPSWAAVEPVDAGTFRVISDGCRILYDPTGLLRELIDTVKSIQNGRSAL
jgi:uncharacterized protein